MKNGIKRVLKRIIIAAGVLLSLFVLLVILLLIDNQRRIDERNEYYRLHKEEIEAQREAEFVALDFSVEDSSEELVVDTYQSGLSGKSLNVYDSAYLDMYFDYPSLEVNDVKRTLKANRKIPKAPKP